MSPQGSGKGLILSRLLCSIFDKLGHHVVNFSSIIDRFNSELAFKSYVFIDEGVHMSKKEDNDKMKVLITEAKFRHEAKFAEAESNVSWHNFVIAVGCMFLYQTPL